jgi:hypothetical protein
MTCEFQSLYFDNDGYIVRCKHCGHYQVAFLCICITLNESDFQAFCRIVKSKFEESRSSFAEHSKCIVIQTPAEGISFLLTKAEAKTFIQILEEADNESKALSLISLFNP